MTQAIERPSEQERKLTNLLTTAIKLGEQADRRRIELEQHYIDIRYEVECVLSQLYYNRIDTAIRMLKAALEK